MHDQRHESGGLVLGPGMGVGGGGVSQPLPSSSFKGKRSYQRVGGVGGGGGGGGMGARGMTGRNRVEEGVGSPEWLEPLLKADLRGFVGTRYARSRLKQTLVSLVL